MDDHLNSDEINVSELFATLIHGCFTIVISIAVCGFLAIYYALFVAVEKFESKAVFSLKSAQSNLNLGQMNSLAFLTGVSLETSGSQATFAKTQMQSRDFLLSIATTLDLFSDPEYNSSLISETSESSPRNTLFKHMTDFLMLMRSKDDQKDSLQMIDQQDIVEYRIIKKLSRGLQLDFDDVVSIRYVDTNAKRATLIVNTALDQILVDLKKQSEIETRAKLDYLEGELLRVQTELESSAENLQEYALTNNLGSIQELAKSSLALEELRDQRDILAESAKALLYLSVNDPWDTAFLTELSIKYPITASLDFRRRLSLGRDFENWIRPSDDLLGAARLKVDRQISDLENVIARQSRDAESTAIQAMDLAKLERNVKVKETIYEVLVKQFETNALTSGLPGEIAQVYERAVPAIERAAPRRSLIVSLGLLLGGFVGSAIVLIMSARRGVVRTIPSLIDRLGRNAFYIEANANRSLRSRSLKRALKKLSSKAVRLRLLSPLLKGDPDVACVISSSDPYTTRSLGLELASCLSKGEARTVLMDLGNLWTSQNSEILDVNTWSSFNKTEFDGKITLVQPSDLFDPRELDKLIDYFRKQEAKVLIVSDDVEVALRELSPLKEKINCWIGNVIVGVSRRSDLITFTKFSGIISNSMLYVIGK